ncbi:hypothetical protein Q1695_012527 [Nippostrongylus brasiliensis]|nr:hypothetical protein Q1695_012527 [Nippostrongylus brasiliensis]
MSRPSAPKGLLNLFVLLVINSVLLCFCYLLYTLDWIRHTTTCGETGIVISYVAATCSIFYATVAVCSAVSLCVHFKNPHKSECFCRLAILISFASLVFAVISVGIMFVSLYFKYSPMCLKLLGGMADVAYMTVVCSFNLVSFFALLLASILYLDTATRTGIDSPLEKTGKLGDSKACTVSTISQEV